MVIARISKRLPDGHDRALETAELANKAGLQHVHVKADPVHGTYVIEADEPADTDR